MARKLIPLMLITLGLCAGVADAKTYIGCGDRQEFAITAHPRECFLDWPDLPLAYAVDLRRIHWRSWGGQVAPARAVWRFRTDLPWDHVRVWAFRRRNCGHGALYTRVRVKGSSFDRTWKTMECRDVPSDR